MAKEKAILKYLGNGSDVFGIFPGLPARDLTQSDLDEHRYYAHDLVATRLFEFAPDVPVAYVAPVEVLDIPAPVAVDASPAAVKSTPDTKK